MELTPRVIPCCIVRILEECSRYISLLDVPNLKKVHFVRQITLGLNHSWWAPFKYKHWLYMCRTWNRFLSMEDDRINKQIFIQDYTSNVQNWSTDFQNVCTSLEFNVAFENLCTIDMDLFETKLDEFFFGKLSDVYM